MRDSIVIATFEHKHGRDVRAFANEDGAEAWRHEIAASYWAQASDAPMPACPIETANRYFELGESYGDEWFSTELTTVEGAKPDPVRDTAPALLAALRAVLPYAESRLEDMEDECERLGRIDPETVAARAALASAFAAIAAAEARA